MPRRIPCATSRERFRPEWNHDERRETARDLDSRAFCFGNALGLIVGVAIAVMVGAGLLSPGASRAQELNAADELIRPHTPAQAQARPPAPQRGLGGLNLLRIADQSSPRATLRSVLNLSRDLIETWRAEGATDRAYALLSGLARTLDFSATADGGQAIEQVRHILLLREILDRMVLPPLADVPGADAAADGLASWTIPNTELRITRITDGNDAGEYVFSAGTVAELQLTYNRVRAMPYQPGALPVLEEWEAGARSMLRADSEIEDRLSRIDSSSPRSVLTSFLHHTNMAYRIAKDAEARLTAQPPTITLDEARAANDLATAHLRRASTAFDMTGVPGSQIRDVRIEATLKLKEVFDRVVLPPIHEIPNAAGVRPLERKDQPFVWRFPGLPVKIKLIDSNDRTGAYTFDSFTLAELGNTYRRLKDLPYIERLPLRSAWEYNGTDALSPGFYNFYISTPGSLVPSSSVLGRAVSALPGWLKTVHGGLTVWQWAGLVVASVAAFIAALVVRAVVTRVGDRLLSPLDQWWRLFGPLAIITLLVTLRWLVDEELNVTGDVLEWFLNAVNVTIILFSAWCVWLFFMALATTLIMSVRVADRGIDAGLVRMLLGLVAIIFAIAVVVSGLQDLGLDAVPLIAGLGVGGLAVALALRPTLENLIGGLILHSDRPVRIGDFCSVGGMTGHIERIGVRSTKIRALDRTLISIPNSRLADMDIINWAQCDQLLVSATLGLRYETTPDQLRHLLTKIRRMLHAHPKIDRETVRIRYAGPGASSRDVSVRIYIKTRDWNEYHAVREDVFLRIDDLVEASGVGYAFPSQTLYLTRDQLPDAERAAAAEAEVAAWRAANTMPFPRLDERTINDLEATLDYPPRGSNRSIHGEDDVEPAAEPLSADPPPDDAAPTDKRAK